MRKSVGVYVLLSLCFLLPAGAGEQEPNCRIGQAGAVTTPAGIETLYFIEKPVLKSSCSASATCGPSSPWSLFCGGFNSCYAVDQNCSTGQNGYVLCDGVRTDCSPCSSSGSCDQLNQQFPGCNYTYNSAGSCCIPELQDPGCPQEPCFGF
jgi:hypothetical protein